MADKACPRLRAFLVRASLRCLTNDCRRTPGHVPALRSGPVLVSPDINVDGDGRLFPKYPGSTAMRLSRSNLDYPPLVDG